MTNLKRGDVYLVDFDPTMGAEIRKTRPALVLQNDVANRHSPITLDEDRRPSHHVFP